MSKRLISVVLRRGGVVILAVIAVTVASLVAPPPGDSAPNWPAQAARACEHLDGTFSMPGGNELFVCTFPSSVDVVELVDSPRSNRLVMMCFGPAEGQGFNFLVEDNALVCLAVND